MTTYTLAVAIWYCEDKPLVHTLFSEESDEAFFWARELCDRYGHRNINTVVLAVDGTPWLTKAELCDLPVQVF